MTIDTTGPVCPKCEAENEKDAVICSSCGAEIKVKKRFKETQMQALERPPDESIPSIAMRAKKPGER
ncbi:MAG: zinc ribbon domain-containing protein [Coriobacteriia bacterium]|nr:zinc ribbon domain-containing protein [Coriobacteriia bacterium]